MVDVLDGLIEVGDDFDRDNRCEELGRVVFVAGGDSVLDQRPGLFATAHLYTLGRQHCGNGQQEARRAGAGDEQRFGGVAGAVALGLRVLDDGERLVRVCFVVKIDMAVAVEVLDHRYARFGQQARDQPLATARDDHIDVLAHGDQVANGGAIGRVDDLHRVRRQARRRQPFVDECRDCAIATDCFRAATQDRRVAGFQAERRSVGGDIRTRFVNDADDSKRYAHLADLDAARAELEVADLADRIRQRGDLFDTLGHRLDAFLGQRQTVEHRGFESGSTCGFHVLLVGGKQFRRFAPDGGGNGAQRAVLAVAVGTGDVTRGGACLLPNGSHVLRYIHGRSVEFCQTLIIASEGIISLKEPLERYTL